MSVQLEHDDSCLRVYTICTLPIPSQRSQKEALNLALPMIMNVLEHVY